MKFSCSILIVLAVSMVECRRVVSNPDDSTHGATNRHRRSPYGSNPVATAGTAAYGATKTAAVGIAQGVEIAADGTYETAHQIVTGGGRYTRSAYGSNPVATAGTAAYGATKTAAVGIAKGVEIAADGTYETAHQIVTGGGRYTRSAYGSNPVATAGTAAYGATKTAAVGIAKGVEIAADGTYETAHQIVTGGGRYTRSAYGSNPVATAGTAAYGATKTAAVGIAQGVEIAADGTYETAHQIVTGGGRYTRSAYGSNPVATAGTAAYGATKTAAVGIAKGVEIAADGTYETAHQIVTGGGRYTRSAYGSNPVATAGTAAYGATKTAAVGIAQGVEIAADGTYETAHQIVTGGGRYTRSAYGSNPVATAGTAAYGATKTAAVGIAKGVEIAADGTYETAHQIVTGGGRYTRSAYGSNPVATAGTAAYGATKTAAVGIAKGVEIAADGTYETAHQIVTGGGRYTRSAYGSNPFATAGTAAYGATKTAAVGIAQGVEIAADGTYETAHQIVTGGGRYTRSAYGSNPVATAGTAAYGATKTAAVGIAKGVEIAADGTYETAHQIVTGGGRYTRSAYGSNPVATAGTAAYGATKTAAVGIAQGVEIAADGTYETAHQIVTGGGRYI